MKVNCRDKSYPYLLREIHDRPEWIYYRGDIELLNNKYIVSIVGSRNPSEKGRYLARKISRGLSNSGVVVVSGMAIGIDFEVQMECVVNGVKTVAVLAMGVDKPQPGQNYRLYNSILNSGGLVISEQNINTQYTRQLYVYRNRLISGSSRIVIAVEGEENSGTLSTVRWALEQGREVLTVGGLESYVNKLIKENGGIEIENANDVLQILEDMSLSM